MTTAQQPVQLSEIYRFLAQTMRYPEKEWFDNNFLSLYATLLENLEWQEQDKFVCKISDEYLESLQVEYTRLFITGSPHVIAPPYASVYCDDTMNGPMTARTREFYVEHGYDLTNNDFPDHIVTELDFAALLEQEKNDSSEIFILKLFRPWFVHFKTKVLTQSSENYFQTTIKLIDFFTSPDSDN